MSTSIADERKLLAAEEYEPVARSHYPALMDLKREELVDLVRWLRDQRAKFRGMVGHRRRVRRGKTDPRNAATEQSSERGVAAKKQVFARALKRVNGRLDNVLAGEKRAAMRAGMASALESKRAASVHHPQSGRRARTGARAIENPKGPDLVDRAEVGRVFQAVRTSQAHRDEKDK